MADCTCDDRIRPEPVWLTRADGLQQSILFVPGYNCNQPAQSPTGHGVHGMEIWFELRGPDGGVSFVMFTGWVPGKLASGHGLSPSGVYTWDYGSHPGEMNDPEGAYISYHAKSPRYEGHELTRGDCPLTGGPCYSHTGYSAADDAGYRFRTEGDSAIWSELKEWYTDKLGDGNG